MLSRTRCSLTGTIRSRRCSRRRSRSRGWGRRLPRAAATARLAARPNPWRCESWPSGLPGEKGNGCGFNNLITDEEGIMFFLLLYSYLLLLPHYFPFFLVFISVLRCGFFFRFLFIYLFYNFCFNLCDVEEIVFFFSFVSLSFNASSLFSSGFYLSIL